MNGMNRWIGFLLVVLTPATRGVAANSPVEAPLPDPAVHEYRLERTSAPIGVVTDIPPPLPLDQVRKIKLANPTTSSVTLDDEPEPPNPPPERYRPLIPTRETVPLRNRPERTESGIYRVSRPRPTPRVVLRSYPDRITLVGGKPLRCRVIQEKNASIQLELENGAIVDMPRSRIQQLVRDVEDP